MISTLTVCEDNMKAAAGKGFINATDLADYLVKKGLPFRTAYKISGEIVAQCIKENKILETLTLEEYKKHSDLFENDLFHEISLETCVAKRISKGGTSVKSVQEQIEAVKEKIK
jgi:argininosuccinate lyase